MARREVHMPAPTDIPTNPARDVARNDRRWLKLGLVAVMAVIVLASLILGWQINRARATRRAIRAGEAAGGKVLFNDFDPSRSRTNRLSWVPRWMVVLLGVEYFHDVVNVYVSNQDTWDDEASRHLLAFSRLERFSNYEIRPYGRKPGITDATLSVLASLPSLRDLVLVGNGITDKGVRLLGSCRSLKSLTIWSDTLGGAGLADLANLPMLRELDLYSCPIDDDGVNALARLTNLEILEFGHEAKDCQRRCVWNSPWHKLRILTLFAADLRHADWASLPRLTTLESLDLSGTNISDADLPAFANLKSLQELDLEHAKVSIRAVDALRAKLPGAVIVAPEIERAPAPGPRPGG